MLRLSKVAAVCLALAATIAFAPASAFARGGGGGGHGGGLGAAMGVGEAAISAAAATSTEVVPASGSDSTPTMDTTRAASGSAGCADALWAALAAGASLLLKLWAFAKKEAGCHPLGRVRAPGLRPYSHVCD